MYAGICRWHMYAGICRCIHVEVYKFTAVANTRKESVMPLLDVIFHNSDPTPGQLTSPLTTTGPLFREFCLLLVFVWGLKVHCFRVSYSCSRLLLLSTCSLCLSLEVMYAYVYMNVYECMCIYVCMYVCAYMYCMYVCIYRCMCA